MGIEVIFLLLVAFLVLGPKRLPNIARQAGGIMAEFNRKKREFQNQIEEEIQRLELKPSQLQLRMVSRSAQCVQRNQNRKTLWQI